MNNVEFVNLVNVLESVYGTFNGVYICHKDLYLDGLNVELKKVHGSDYSLGEIQLGENSKLSILVAESKLYENYNRLKLVLENGEVIRFDL